MPGPVAPVETTIRMVSAHTGRSVVQVQTDANGDFKIGLPPGDYFPVADLVPQPADPDAVCAVVAAPMEASVEVKGFLNVGIKGLIAFRIAVAGVGL